MMKETKAEQIALGAILRARHLRRITWSRARYSELSSIAIYLKTLG
jgi:hypothetical protein